MELVQNALDCEIPIRELIIRALPNLFRSALVEQLVYAEVSLEFKVRPVIQRISECVRDGARPRQEFLIRVCIASAVPLRHTVSAHGAPLVVIALEPNLCEIAKAMVISDVLRGKMAVIIEDRLFGRKLPVKATRRFGSEKKVFGDEFHKCDPSPSRLSRRAGFRAELTSSCCPPYPNACRARYCFVPL